MDWKEALGSRLVSPDEAVAPVSSGMSVACSLTEPSDLCAALARRDDLREVTVISAVLLPGGATLAGNGHFRVITAFATPVSYPLMRQGLVEYVPIQFSQGHRWFESDHQTDVVMVRLTPPDERGLCSYGWTAGFTPDLVRLARERSVPLLAEIDTSMPYTLSDQNVPVEAITYAIDPMRGADGSMSCVGCHQSVAHGP